MRDEVYFNGKCFLKYDFSDVLKNASVAEQDDIYDKLMELIDALADIAFDDSEAGKKFNSETEAIWKGNEDLYRIGRETHDEVMKEGFELLEIGRAHREALRKKLTAEQFATWSKLYDEECDHESDNLDVFNRTSVFSFKHN